MIDNTVIDHLQSDTATFTQTLLYRDRSDMHEQMLRHDGNVVLLSKTRSDSRHSLWRMLHEAVTTDDFNGLIVSPVESAVRGAILLLTDEIDRSPFTDAEWGISRTTQTSIEFENGNRIRSICGSEDNIDRCRGTQFDMIAVDNWTEQGSSNDDEFIESIVCPAAHDGNVWVNDTNLSNTPIMESVLTHGAYVERIGQ